MPQTVRNNISARIGILNYLQDETKKKLARMASELYSYSLQGFYNWLVNLPEDFLMSMNITEPKVKLCINLIEIAGSRRATALQGILQHTGTQANQHAAEPSGFVTHSDLYNLLEIYKAAVVQDFLTYTHGLQHRHVEVAEFDERLAEYLQVQFLGLCFRYLYLLRKAPRHFAHMQLWHWQFRVPTYASVASSARFLGRRHHFRTIAPTIEQRGERFLHVRVGVNLDTKQYDVKIQWNNDDDVSNNYFDDSGDLWSFLKVRIPPLLMPKTTLVQASLVGGIFHLCKTPRWKTNFEHDNRLIFTLGRMFLIVQPPFQYVRDFVEKIRPFPRDDVTVRKFIRDSFGNRLSKGFRNLINDFLRALPRIYELDVLRAINLNGGYDNVGTRDLFTKLQGALSGTTCIQDVAAELCEFLSVPYPPEREEFAAFQVDHTGIPDLINFQN